MCVCTPRALGAHLFTSYETAVELPRRSPGAVPSSEPVFVLKAGPTSSLGLGASDAGGAELPLGKFCHLPGGISKTRLRRGRPEIAGDLLRDPYQELSLRKATPDFNSIFKTLQ